MCNPTTSSAFQSPPVHPPTNMQLLDRHQVPTIKSLLSPRTGMETGWELWGGGFRTDLSYDNPSAFFSSNLIHHRMAPVEKKR